MDITSPSVRMKHLASLATLMVLAACSPQAANEDTRRAEAAGRSWLGLVFDMHARDSEHLG